MLTEPNHPGVPKNFLRPCVLLLLREDSAHGYALLERLRAFGFGNSDPGGLYRALRALETDGLVRSDWERSGEGPDRRTYEITRAGMEVLHERAKGLLDSRNKIDHFLSRYEEFVALRPGRGTAAAKSKGEPGPVEDAASGEAEAVPARG